ncbi:trichohyalin [Bicyclus anynana]|uniref:Trichohyalin n=1 Tax=Bicyclus anynana TaxID=110368 RepID=A0A6J1MW74_BICAN|nr:trichohyalin [Bicyclus anynana]XP_023937131.2 trichohyalin [Bicyclus anynana]
MLCLSNQVIIINESMEEIWKKELIDEKDLTKCSPDYNPQDIYLRMQLRRDMVKDTHSHGVTVRTNCQKKNISKTKNCYKTRKEIVKLRAYFQNKNLQNQCMLKDVDRINQNRYFRTYKNVYRDKAVLNIDDNNLIEEDIVLCTSNPVDDQVNLIIENDSEFKLIKKDKCDILQMDNNHSKKSIKNIDKKDDKISGIVSNDYSEIKAITKVSLNHRSSPPAALNSSCDENKTIKKENGICSDLMSSYNNEYKNDLQSLLIMMTIHSTVHETNEPDEPQGTEGEALDDNIGNFNIDVKDSTKKRYELLDETEIGELEKLLNIQPIVHRTLREKYIIKKYVILWKLFVKKNRENDILQQRQETLNVFFDKLAKKKSNTTSATEPERKSLYLVRDYNSYRHRYKLQKHIIALQKAKLEEQNKVIEQLKYNKIVEASRQSLDTMREDIRKAYYDIDKHLKPKIKCLTNELKLKELEEPSLVLHCLKVPQFLQRMEARARQREEKHAIIRERRKQMEEERIRLKQQAELAKTEMDKEEKLKRLRDLKEKRKREKVESIRKKQHAERLRALIVMADLHYEKNLMVKYGIKPLRKLLEIKRDNMQKAKAHCRFQTLKNTFLNWMWYTEDMWFERNFKADDFYRKKLLSKTFNSLKKNHHEFVLKKQVAEDYYDLYVTQVVFTKFRKGIEIIKQELEIKVVKATLYYNSNILFKTFTCWRSLPALNALKREQDARKLKWRQKVLLVVPDYKPPED